RHRDLRQDGATVMSKIEIWNLALGHLRAGSIQSELERSAAREYCELYYPACKSSLLSEGPWGFATTKVALASRSEVPAGWPNAFVLPEGHLRIWSVHPHHGGAFDSDRGNHFELRYNVSEGTTDLVTEIPNPVARITMLVSDEVLPQHIVIAL